MKFFKHQQAIVESDKIGENTEIRAFTHVFPDVIIGVDCNIGTHVFIGNDVTIGDRVTIKSGTQLSGGIIIENDVFIGTNSTFSSDFFPREQQNREKSGKTIIRNGASVGANATLFPGIIVGKNAVIGAGSVVTQNVPPNAIISGNPAVKEGYVDSITNQNRFPSQGSQESSTTTRKSIVSDVQIVKMPFIRDIRGNLTVGEYNHHLPFVPKRYFLIFDVPSKKVRGERHMGIVGEVGKIRKV